VTPLEQLVRIPLFCERSKSDFAVERLPGLCNRTYKVAVNDKCFVLKMPGVQVQPVDYARNEQRNATLAATLGIAPEVVWCDGQTGVTLFKHVPHSKSLRATDFGAADTLCRAVELLREVHCGQHSFVGRLDPWQAVDDYIVQVANAGPRSQDYVEAVERNRSCGA
jgi:hypothetical protein